jgi:hypothetical protein
VCASDEHGKDSGDQPWDRLFLLHLRTSQRQAIPTISIKAADALVVAHLDVVVEQEQVALTIE